MTSGRQRTDRHGCCPIIITTNFALISLKSTEPWAALMLLFKHFSLKSLGKTLHEGPQDSSLGSAPPCVYLLLCHIPVHVTKSPRPSHSILSIQKLNCGEGLGTRLKTAFVWLTFLLNAHQITNQVNWKCPLTHQQLCACCTCSQNFIASLKSFQAEKQNLK